MTIRITRFHHYERGNMYGFVDVSVPAWGTDMHIKGCKVFQKEGRQWVSLPSREYQDDSGATKYQSIISLEDESVFKKLTKSLTEAWLDYAKNNPPQGSDIEPQNTNIDPQPSESELPF